jgi:hypothetical protein
MSTPNETFDMVVNKQGEVTPSVVTLHKSMNQNVLLSVADKTTEIYCQFYIIHDNKYTPEGPSFTIGKGVTKTYDANKHVDGSHYLVTTVEQSALNNINPDELKLGEGGSGQIIIDD